MLDVFVGDMITEGALPRYAVSLNIIAPDFEGTSDAIAILGRLMYDGEGPDLFDHISAVAQRLGVYTVRDYADIERHFAETQGTADRQLTGPRSFCASTPSVSNRKPTS